MRVIGITGGVGAGKSTVLKLIKEQYGAVILQADEIAHELMKPGTRVYDQIKASFPAEIFGENGEIVKEALAKLIFTDDAQRERINSIVHPGVYQYIDEEVRKLRKDQAVNLVLVEAALLIEEHYERICDEFWYVFASEEVRRERLMASRGYSKEKIAQIFKSQLSEEEFRKHCNAVIENNGDLTVTMKQMKQELQ